MTKTNEEVQALKDNWLKDPHWDIEDTEGFEEHAFDLLVFRKDQEREWQILAEDGRLRRANVVKVETGITDPAIQQNIKTFGEIENEITYAIHYESGLSMAAASARATLLLAAQVARIADALEQRNEDDQSDAHLDHMTRLYKGE